MIRVCLRCREGFTPSDGRDWHCDACASPRRRDEGIDMNDLLRSIPEPKFPKPRD